MKHISEILKTKLPECPYCGSVEKAFSLKLIPTSRPDLHHFPKYIPQIKENCGSCGKWLKFAAQDSLLIEKFNEQLEEMTLE